MQIMNVLVADDEERVCALICALIDWDALDLHLVGTAYDGIQALQLIKETQPDLVITDIRMPGLDGLQLISQAKELQPQLQFIIISGHKQFDYAQSAIKFGVGEYLLKPIKKAELNQTLQRMRESFDKHMQERTLQQQVKEDKAYVKRAGFAGFLEHGQDQLLAPWYVPSSLMQIGVVGIQGSSREPVAKLLQKKLEEFIIQEIPEKTIEVTLYPQDGDIYFLLQYTNDHKAVLEALRVGLVNVLKTQSQIFQDILCTLALGIPVSELASLGNSYLSAKQALSKRLVLGHEVWYQADQLEDDTCTSYLNDIASSFEQCCAQAETDATTFCKPLFSRFEMDGATVHIIQETLIRSHAQALDFLRTQLQAELDDHEVVFDHHQCNTLEELKHHYCIAMQDLLTGYQRIRDTSVSKPIRLALEYLEHHYQDEMISLEAVSGHVQLNSSYFSALFKKRVGMGFAEYVLDLRIQEAKRLLVETNLTVANIAVMVGYHDPKHFAKLFRKVCQIKPNEYRKLYG